MGTSRILTCGDEVEAVFNCKKCGEVVVKEKLEGYGFALEPGVPYGSLFGRGV